MMAVRKFLLILPVPCPSLPFNSFANLILYFVIQSFIRKVVFEFSADICCQISCIIRFPFPQHQVHYYLYPLESQFSAIKNQAISILIHNPLEVERK